MIRRHIRRWPTTAAVLALFVIAEAVASAWKL
jgi:hypothetical protein